MRPILISIFLLFNITLCAQDIIPTLKTNGNSLADLQPKDWKLVDQQTGDLNGDNIKDLVFIIQGADTSKIDNSENGEYVIVNTNKRILAIYFADASGTYTKQFQGENFILLKEDEYQDDPFSKMEITSKGVLKIEFNHWMSAGTWESANEKYLFKFNKERKQFELIGYAYSWFMRDSFEGEEFSMNFPAGKLSKRVNPMQDEKVKATWTKFTLDSLKTLEEIAEPGSWKFMDLYI